MKGWLKNVPDERAVYTYMIQMRDCSRRRTRDPAQEVPML